MNYTLDQNAAKQADNVFSKIDQKGKYLGVLTRAEPVTSSRGSNGVDFSFKANDGATADYLTLWTHNAAGKQLSGFNVLMAIMTCLRVRELKEETGEIEKYDSALKKRVKVSVPLFKELMGKQFGLLIQMEEYAKTSGGTAWKPVILAACDKDGFTASEILAKSQKPEAIDKMTLALRDRPLRSGSAPAGNDTTPAPSGDPFAGFDDDIPF